MKNATGSPQRVRGRQLSEIQADAKGFAIVEVIVAMLLLAVVLAALAPLMYSVSQSTMKVAGSAFRNGVEMHEVNRLETLPYDSLPIGVNSFSVASAPYPHTRVVTIAEPVANLKTIRIVVTPVNIKYKPDTVNFTRTRARTTRALNTVLP
jgi:hypothetical protein